MNIKYNKSQISPLTWFFIGLATGLVGMFFYQMGVRDKYAQERADADFDYYLSRKAFIAYQTESKPVAIFALSEYLANAERLRGKSRSFVATTDSPFWMLQAHALLARLYAESGESKLSAQHLEMALGFARATGTYPLMTNQASLWDFINHHYGTVSK